MALHRSGASLDLEPELPPDVDAADEAEVGDVQVCQCLETQLDAADEADVESGVESLVPL